MFKIEVPYQLMVRNSLLPFYSLLYIIIIVTDKYLPNNIIVNDITIKRINLIWKGEVEPV